MLAGGKAGFFVRDEVDFWPAPGCPSDELPIPHQRQQVTRFKARDVQARVAPADPLDDRLAADRAKQRVRHAVSLQRTDEQAISARLLRHEIRLRFAEFPFRAPGRNIARPKANGYAWYLQAVFEMLAAVPTAVEADAPHSDRAKVGNAYFNEADTTFLTEFLRFLECLECSMPAISVAPMHPRSPLEPINAARDLIIWTTFHS